VADPYPNKENNPEKKITQDRIVNDIKVDRVLYIKGTPAFNGRPEFRTI
jgi:hypothetical protein